MDSFHNIEQKLEHFIRRYYLSALLKGLLLFFAIGLLYALLLLSIEHFFWLNSFGRLLLFGGVIGFEAILFYGFIFSPLAKYFKIQKGIDFEAASKIVGDHFPEVKDKLLNVLQLNQQTEHTEFLVASIEQKSNNLSLIPFKSAVNLSENLKYFRYAAIPILIVILCIAFDKQAVFTDSLKRVVNYKTAYTPPAPFEFFIINPNLEAIENLPFTLVAKTVGSVVPEDVRIIYNDEVYLLNQTALGVFEYAFPKPKSAIDFKLVTDEVQSKPYRLEVLAIPALLSLDMYLDYPVYTGKSDQHIANNGNAIVPEGTKIKWELRTKSTDSVAFAYKDTLSFFDQNAQTFYYSQRVFDPLNYTIQTSNAKLKNYENLSFSIQTVKDQSPAIKVEMKKDSTYRESLYFYGQLSDDYGIRALKLHYYPIADASSIKTLDLPATPSAFQEFTHAFPSNVELIDDTAYALYFEVSDNDPFHKNKTTRSRVFNYNSKSENTIQDLQLKEQNELSDAFQKALNTLSKQDKNLNEISRNQKEKAQLNFSDKQKLKSFLERQQAQDKMLKNFNKKMKDNLNQFEKSKKEDPFKAQLEKRLEAQQDALEKDEKLLEELKKITDKINKEALAEKLEDMAKQNKNKQRSLEQLLELTKRYYVTKKAEQIKDNLEQLSKDQTALSKKTEDNTKDAQDKLNTDFKTLQKELDALRKDNDALTKPLALPDDPSLEESIKKDQEQASDELGKKEKSSDAQEQRQREKSAQKSQSKAAQKMQQMSQQMASQMSGGSGEQMSEDIDMLRKILDNLLLFSFDQEALMKRFQSSATNTNGHAKRLVKQNNLREHFEHIDDSLFSLSLRQPKISESINKEITEVFFNIDKSLELLSENSFRKAIGKQQFVISATNTLADLLSNTLDNMEMQMQMSAGDGEGDMQLPDIIMSQEELNKKMEKSLGEKGKSPEGKKEGSEKGDGKPNQSSGEGKEGDSGSKEGQNGKQAKDGQNGGQNGGKNGQSVQKGDTEADTGELFEIFKKQQELRNALQDLLDKKGLGGNGNALLDSMEKIEQDLINQGLTDRLLQDMTSLKHQLLKLETAVQQQGEDTKRVSNTTKAERFQAPVPNAETIKQYFNAPEILNRQSLPLRQEYKLKVQDYFKNNND